MLIISILYIVWITYSLIWWLYIYKKHKNLFWLFFLIFCILSWIWFLWYYTFLSWISSINILLIISKICFYLWILSTYSLLLSIIFLKNWKKVIDPKISLIYWIIVSIIWYIYLFTDKIIKNIIYIEKTWDFREVYWEWIVLNSVLQVIFLISFFFTTLFWFKKLNNLHKLRVKYIIIFSYIFLLIMIVLQSLLPTYDIWIMDKYLIINYIIYIFCINHVIKKYYFTNIGYWALKTWIIIFSFIVANIFNKISNYFTNLNYIWSSELVIDDLIINHIILILVFYLIFNFLNNWLIWHSSKIEIKKILENSEYKISQVNEYEKINSILEVDLNILFKNNFSKIVKITKKSKWNSLLKKIFEEEKLNLIINDIVFYEENNIDKNIINESINDKIYLVFPLFDENSRLSWYLWLWSKNFWEYYSKYEIESIKKFSFFLENHLKYIKNYQQLKTLTYNLDKEVDKKTIQFNRLINRQKEYIWVISHEIKSPVSSAIFQADYIKDEVSKIDNNELNKEVWILNDVLLRIWELTNTLFNSEYFENSEVSLYKEKINISDLIYNEFEYYKSINPNIKFIHNIDENIWYIKLDKIQFKQVLQNLITNAVKFVPSKNWVIFISLYKQRDDIIILVEDNWIWLAWVNTKKIFDRYTSSKENNIWLWLWLYLCKKIIWLHKWEITASRSKSLWWAKFKIKLNKKTLG